MNILAYIDPGTGSFLLQMLAAGLLGAVVAVKALRDRIVLFFKILFGRKNKSNPDNPQDPGPQKPA